LDFALIIMYHIFMDEQTPPQTIDAAAARNEPEATEKTNRPSGIMQRVRALLLAGGMTLAAFTGAHAASPDAVMSQPGQPALSSPDTVENPVPTATPVPSRSDRPERPTPDPEKQQSIDVRGVLREVSNQPNQENISLMIPEISLTGSDITVVVMVTGERTVSSVTVPLASLVGKMLGGDQELLLNPSATTEVTGSLFVTRIEAELQKIGAELTKESRAALLEKASLVVGRNEKTVIIKSTLPRRVSINLDGERQEIEITPDNYSLNIDRSSAYPPNTIFPEDPPSINVSINSGGKNFSSGKFDLVTPEHLVVRVGATSGSGEGVARPPLADSNPQEEATTPSVGATPEVVPAQRSSSVTVRVGGDAPGSHAESPAGSNQSPENNWLKEWQPNETVNLRTWWDDMTSKGYISVDSLAQQFAGNRILSLLNNHVLVPNPVEYWSLKKVVVGTCRGVLRDAITEGQGHIKISSEAFSSIPGGDNCQVSVK
jgi:hypothetical protein